MGSVPIEIGFTECTQDSQDDPQEIEGDYLPGAERKGNEVQGRGGSDRPCSCCSSLEGERRGARGSHRSEWHRQVNTPRSGTQTHTGDSESVEVDRAVNGLRASSTRGQ